MKIPKIKSAHDSETRNIINALIERFNDMGYTYDQAMQMAQDVLDEAQEVNDRNTNTNERLDNIIVDSGTSSTEVVDARGTHTVLGGRLNTVDDKLAEKENYRQSKTGSSVNMIAGYEGNAIASDLSSGTISGGGMEGAENVIGGNLNNVGTSNPNNDPMELETDAQLAVIGGGYDNVVNGKAGVLTGYHCKIVTGSTHGTVSGGSYHEINSGDYNFVGGGTRNKINESYATISGGSGNEVNGNGSTVSGGIGSTANGRNNAIGGGFSNTSDGNDTTISGGNNNNASGRASTISGGYYQEATGDYSTVSGGFTNKATGSYSSIVGGRDNEANAPYSTVIGRNGKSSISGEFVQAQGMFSEPGDSQFSRIPLRKQTTDSTTVSMGADTGAASLILPVDGLWGFTCIVTAQRTDVFGEVAMWEIKGLARRTGSGSVDLIGAPSITEIGKSDGVVWDVSMRRSGYAIVFDVTGESGKTINWIGKLDINQQIA